MLIFFHLQNFQQITINDMTSFMRNFKFNNIPWEFDMNRFKREVVRRDCLVCVGMTCDPIVSDPLPSILFSLTVSDSCTGDDANV